MIIHSGAGYADGARASVTTAVNTEPTTAEQGPSADDLLPSDFLTQQFKDLYTEEAATQHAVLKGKHYHLSDLPTSLPI